MGFVAPEIGKVLWLKYIYIKIKPMSMRVWTWFMSAMDYLHDKLVVILLFGYSATEEVIILEY